MPSSRNQNLPASAQGLNQNFGVLQSSFSKEEILVIMVTILDDGLTIWPVNKECKNSCPLKSNRNKTQLKWNRWRHCLFLYKPIGPEESQLFCAELWPAWTAASPVQKARGRVRLAPCKWGSPLPGHPGTSVQPAVCHVNIPRAPHPFARRSLSQRSFSSDYVPAVPFGASSFNLLCSSGLLFRKRRRTHLHPHIAHACLHEHSRAVTVPWLQREAHVVLLPPYMTGKD